MRTYISLAFVTISAIALAPELGCGGRQSHKLLLYDDLVYACVRAMICSVKAYLRVSNCIDNYYLRLRPFGLGPVYDELYRCINGASNCEDMFKCFGTSQTAGTCDSKFQGRCDGDKAISCDLLDHRVYVYNCGKADLTCKVPQENVFEAACTIGACPSNFKRRCDGAFMIDCSSGLQIVEDCGAQGTVCGTSSTGIVACIGAQKESCDTQKHQPKCEGSVAISCIGGKLHRSDCNAQILAKTCKDGACASSGTECLDDFDRCQGEKLQTCIDGRWIDIDCAALRLGRCVPATNGAACSPPL